MNKTITRLSLVVALLCTSVTAFSQKTYRELGSISRLNRSVSGLRSMNDGEHYTISRAGAVLRFSYADESVCDTLYRGQFASYALSPKEDMVVVGNNFRPVYRRSFYADYDIVTVPDGRTVHSLKDIRDLSLSPDSKMIAYARDNNLFIADLGGAERAVTTDGEWNKIINATADWVYEEEYGFTKAYAFSPDSKKIA